MITNFKTFETNNKNYIITTYNYKEIFTLNSENEEYSYELNDVEFVNYQNNKLKFFTLKFFTSYNEAKEFIIFLQKNYHTYKKYKFKIIPHDKFEMILYTRKYNL